MGRDCASSYAVLKMINGLRALSWRLRAQLERSFFTRPVLRVWLTQNIQQVLSRQTCSSVRAPQSYELSCYLKEQLAKSFHHKVCP